jgi:hypothetical protein
MPSGFRPRAWLCSASSAVSPSRVSSGHRGWAARTVGRSWGESWDGPRVTWADKNRWAAASRTAVSFGHHRWRRRRVPALQASYRLVYRASNPVASMAARGVGGLRRRQRSPRGGHRPPFYPPPWGRLLERRVVRHPGEADGPPRVGPVVEVLSQPAAVGLEELPGGQQGEPLVRGVRLLRVWRRVRRERIPSRRQGRCGESNRRLGQATRGTHAGLEGSTRQKDFDRART